MQSRPEVGVGEADPRQFDTRQNQIPVPWKTTQGYISTIVTVSVSATVK